jgi:hypothetical protein
MRLSAIEVENFQSFADRQRVEFGLLTLFFGPNSAGKSAITDAYSLMTAYLFDESEHRIIKLDDMITRWTRLRRTAGHKPIKFKDTAVSVEFPYLERWLAATKLDISGELLTATRVLLQEKTIRINLTFISRDFSGSERTNYLKAFEVFVEDSPFITLHLNEGSYQEYVKRIYCTGSLSDDPAQRQLDEGLFQQLSDAMHTESVGENVYGYFEQKAHPLSSLANPKQLVDPINKSTTEFNNLWNTLFDLVLANEKEIFDDSPPVVEGDRGLIEDSLLTVDLNLNWDDNYPEKSFNDKSLTDYWIKTLATCAYASLIRKAQTVKGWSNLLSYGGINHTGRGLIYQLARRLDRINEYLDKSLFIDKLYSVNCSATLAVDLDLTKNPIHKRNRIGSKARVTLELLDADSNELSIKDVGSGIPYCLPWLTAITAEGSIWIHQPELHLHPALQTRVGDVLISALAERSTAKSIVVETHSEHIILRLLRRIRETTNNPESPFALKYDEIEVYYFDPEVNSGTTIKRLPVTEAGEFYLPWPNGFFRERDEDLWHGE